MFGGYRTYHRCGQWIFKGLAALRQAEAEGCVENVFLRSDAPEQLGLGPVMMQAVRFWFSACGLTTLPSKAERTFRGRSPHLMDFGKLLWRSDPLEGKRRVPWTIASPGFTALAE